MSIPTDSVLSAVSAIIPFLAGLYNYRQLSWEMKILLLFLTCSVLVEAVSNYLAFHNIHNLWLFHIFTLLEFSLLTYVFSCWQKTAVQKRLLRLGIVAFALFWIAAKFSLEEFGSLDTFTSSLSGALLVVMALHTLALLAEDNYYHSLLIDSRFWVSIAVLIYYGGTLLIQMSGAINGFWTLHNILNITANLGFAGGFITCYRLNFGGSSP